MNKIGIAAFGSTILLLASLFFYFDPLSEQVTDPIILEVRDLKEEVRELKEDVRTLRKANRDISIEITKEIEESRSEHRSDLIQIRTDIRRLRMMR